MRRTDRRAIWRNTDRAGAASARRPFAAQRGRARKTHGARESAKEETVRQKEEGPRRPHVASVAASESPDKPLLAELGDPHSVFGFFTRALRPDGRPLAKADLICPVDGAISQFGAMDGKQILQAKGHHYLTTTLVGGDVMRACPGHCRAR